MILFFSYFLQLAYFSDSLIPLSSPLIHYIITMKQAISLSLFLIVGAHLVTAKFDFKWPLSWPQLPSWAIPNNRKFNGLTDPMTVPKINDACAVNHEGRTFHGKCQSEAIGPSGGCPNDVSLYGCGAERKRILSLMNSFSLSSFFRRVTGIWSTGWWWLLRDAI